MKKFNFALISLGLVAVSVSAISQSSIPLVPPTNFSNPQQCSEFYYNFSNNLGTNVDFSYYNFFYRFSVSYGGQNIQNENCSNGKCVWQYYYHVNGATPPGPAAGGCSLVGTDFWPQATQTLQSAYSILVSSQGQTSIAGKYPTSYGIYCTNTTGQSPSPPFQGCQLLSSN